MNRTFGTMLPAEIKGNDMVLFILELVPQNDGTGNFGKKVECSPPRDC